MKPILFKIFNINIYGYGTMIAIGISAALLLLMYQAKKKDYDEDSILNMTIIAVVSGILGGKLLYILTEIKAVVNTPGMLKNVGNGFVIYGAILGGALAVFIYSRHKKWNSLKIFDMVMPTVALAQGFGRIGCFFAGCCYGRATSLFLGVEFKDSPFAPPGIVRHPTQLYSSAFDFLLAIFLLWYGKKSKDDGRVLSMYIILYSVGRFIIEFLRDDPRGNVGILSTSQFISIFAFILGIVIFNINKILKKQKIEEVL